ncbi:MAG TPA: hypothetical protein PLW65_13410 [Pseudomonadota bacterium]|nr:hypothetical protein [Pseudomonadota bacterium]
MEMPLDRPLPASMTVREGRDAYLAENGFSVAAYDEAWTKATLFGLPIAVPNTPHHKWALKLHDLHHVATGYGTDHTGEGEISAWELRRGLGRLGLYVGSIVAAGTLLGLVLAPRRVWAAFRAAGTQPSLFIEDDVDSLLKLTVGELRARLGLPEGGLATLPRRLHPNAPGAARSSPGSASAAT